MALIWIIICQSCLPSPLPEQTSNIITYDTIGNPLNYRDGITFTWTNGRQLQSYTKNNNTITYTYDDGGMRLSKDVGNTHYTYLYNSGLLMQETIGDKILDYSYTPGGQILSVRYKANAYATCWMGWDCNMDNYAV